MKCPKDKAGKVDSIKNFVPKNSGKMEWKAKSSNGEGKIVEEIVDEVREMVVGPPSVI
jgi:hypothetical protein